MMFLLKQIFGFLKLLNSDTGTTSLAAGVACGYILGMTPALSLQSLLVFLCLFIFRIQIGAAFLSAFFFKFIAWTLYGVFDSVGQHILEMDSLQNIFTTMYNMPIIPFTRFNNSIVMGSALVTIITCPIIFILATKLIQKYRETILARIQETKWMKAMKATGLYQWWYKYDQYFGGR